MYDYIRYPQKYLHFQEAEAAVLLHLLLTAKVNPQMACYLGKWLPLGRGDVLTSIQQLSCRLQERPLHIKRTLEKLHGEGLLYWNTPFGKTRIQTNTSPFIITVEHFLRYLPLICGQRNDIPIHRDILNKPWYADSSVKFVYLILLGENENGHMISLPTGTLADVAGISKDKLLSALRLLIKTKDISCMATDRWCEIRICGRKSNVIYVNFNTRQYKGSEIR